MKLSFSLVFFEEKKQAFIMTNPFPDIEIVSFAKSKGRNNTINR